MVPKGYHANFGRNPNGHLLCKARLGLCHPQIRSRADVVRADQNSTNQERQRKIRFSMGPDSRPRKSLVLK